MSLTDEYEYNLCLSCRGQTYGLYCSVCATSDRVMKRFAGRIFEELDDTFHSKYNAEVWLQENYDDDGIRRVLRYMENIGAKNWKYVLPETILNKMKASIKRSSNNGMFVLKTTEGQKELPVSVFGEVRKQVKEQYPLLDVDETIEGSQLRFSESIEIEWSPAYKMWTSHLIITRGQIRGGDLVLTKHGPSTFPRVFNGASIIFKRKGCPFGDQWAAPLDDHNLEVLLNRTVQPFETKLEACIKLLELSKWRETISSSYILRMHTEKYDEQGLHKYVYNEEDDPFIPFRKKKVPILEEWNDYLNGMKPYSQQKITAELSYHARYVSWWIDMRVGKTPTAMMVMRRLLLEKKVDRFIVVAPAVNVKNPWLNELEKQKWFKVAALVNGKDDDIETIQADAHDIYVVSYSSLPRRLKYIQAEFDMERTGWILDETSLIKNPTSKRFKAVANGTEYAPYVFALNGTPLAQGPQDIWSQQFAVDQGRTFGVSYSRFEKEWLYTDYRNKLRLLKERALEFELKLASSSIRYLRSEADQFSGKDKNFRYISIMPTNEMRQDTADVISGFTKDEHGDDRFVKNHVLTVYGHLREICAGYRKYESPPDSGLYTRVIHKQNPKVLWIRTFLKSNPGVPMVIFSENTTIEEEIKRALADDGVSFTDKSGVDEFQNGSVPVILMKTTQAKGVTLNRIPAVENGIGSYPVIVYTQPTWSLVDWEQSQDRCVGTDKKTGKSISTMIYVLFIAGSIEAKILKALRSKKDVASKLLADAERDGFENPFEDMDLSSTSSSVGDETFNSDEMHARYVLGISPEKKLTKNIIIKADVRYRANIEGTTQSFQRNMPLTWHAQTLLNLVEE